jgi:hypothetical protein
MDIVFIEQIILIVTSRHLKLHLTKRILILSFFIHFYQVRMSSHETLFTLQNLISIFFALFMTLHNISTLQGALRYRFTNHLPKQGLETIKSSQEQKIQA